MRGASQPRAFGLRGWDAVIQDNTEYTVRLNYGIPVPDGHYFPFLNLDDPLITKTNRNWVQYAIAPNWPQVPALYGIPIRTNPSPVQQRGGPTKSGISNSGRWNASNLRAYLVGEGMARSGVYAPGLVAPQGGGQ